MSHDESNAQMMPLRMIPANIIRPAIMRPIVVTGA